MKKHFLILICLLIMQSMGLVVAQQDTILVFEGRLDTSPVSTQTIKPCLLRTERLSSDFGGVIEVQFGGGMSEEMQYAIKAAAQLWEEKLYIPKKIILKFEKERMGVEAADFAAQVRYTLLPGGNEAYPQSFFMNFLTDNKRLAEDAIILVNEDVDWDYSFSGEITNKKNLTTAMLRAIAMSLGFGSSVVNNPAKGVVFSTRRYFSPFDNLIVNSNNIRLNMMPNNGRTSQELFSYVSGDNVYYKTPNNDSFKLYAPSEFHGYNYLSYFDTKGDLMSYNIRIGDKNQQIDEKTLEVLKEIGWKEPENSLKIMAKDINATGMASAFQGYSFHAETTSGSITDYSWKYELLNNEMVFDSIKVGNSSEFSIDKVDDLTKYYKNINGDIKGKISLNATVNGTKMSKVFYIYFATKPTFISVKVDAITPIPGTRFYNLDMTVIYTGADLLYAEQTEEISSVGVNTYVYEPYIAHLHFEGIYMIGVAWVDLTLKNKIGKAYYSIEIPSQMNVLDNSTSLKEETMNSSIEYIEVRDIQGRIILQTENYEDVECLTKGIYIILLTYANGEKLVKKIKI